MKHLNFKSSKTWSAIVFACLFQMSTFAQTIPEVDWTINDAPPFTPFMPIAEAYGGATKGTYQLIDGDPCPTQLTGEDWWYGIASAKENGKEVGYYTCGYASWVNFGFDNANLGGCISSSSGIDDHVDHKRPILAGETLSPKQATLSFYDKQGNMVWCRPYLQSQEGAYSCIADDEGNIYITGWTNTTTKNDGNDLLLNPTLNDPGININDEGLCALARDQNYKSFIAKVDKTGELLWVNLYSVGDTPFEAVSHNTQGIDLVFSDNGNIIMQGYCRDETANNNYGIYLVEVNPDGKKIKENTIYNYGKNSTKVKNFITYSISKGTDAYYISGFSHTSGVIVKVNSNDLKIASGGTFGNDAYQFEELDGTNYFKPIYLYETTNMLNNRHTIYDCKELNNGNLAYTLAENCTKCFGSGSNSAVGKLVVINPSNGNTINSSFINQSGNNLLVAFDFKIGIAPNTTDEIITIGTIDQGSIDDTPQDAAIFAQSKAAINNNATNPTMANSAYFNTWDHYITSQNRITHDFTNTDALVSKFDINGNHIWQKSIDADPDPLEVYPCDWKEQECVYQIIKGSAGEYVYVGNTSHNKDDYYVGKLKSTCTYETNYDIQPGSGNTLELYGNQTWNPSFFNGSNSINVKGDIRVKANSTLTIENITVKFADTWKSNSGEVTRIVVERGGKLIVRDNAVLTSSDCPESMWDGIQVYGNAEEILSSYQGEVDFSNSLLENARIGISSTKREGYHTDYAYNGGVIRVKDATFRNNVISIDIKPYEFPSNLPISYILNSTFEITDILNDPIWGYQIDGGNHGDFKPVANKQFIIVEGYDNLRLEGNLFEVNETLFDRDRRGTGVSCWQSNLIIDSYCSQPGQTQGSPCQGSLTPNIFRNLTDAIEIKATSGMKNTNIYNSVFYNNTRAINFHTNPQTAHVENNQFFIKDVEDEFENANVGIYATTSAGLLIENNTFESLTNNDPVEYSAGIFFKNTANLGGTANNIFRNEFTDLSVSIQTSRDNHKLQVDCNTFNHGTNSIIDWDNPEGGILSDQGFCDPNDKLKPVLNYFQGNYGNGEFGIKNDNSNATLFYSGYVQEYPSVVNNVNLDLLCPVVLNDFEETCPLNEYTIRETGEEESLEDKMGSISNNLQNNLGMFDNGNTNNLITIVQNGNNTTVQNELSSASPYLSDYVLISLIHSSVDESVKYNVLSQNTPLRDNVLRVLIEHNADLDKSDYYDLIKNCAPMSNAMVLNFINTENTLNYAEKSTILELNSPLTDDALLQIMQIEEYTDEYLVKDVFVLNTPLKNGVKSTFYNMSYSSWVYDAVANSTVVADNPYAKSLASSSANDLYRENMILNNQLMQETNKLLRYKIDKEELNDVLDVLNQLPNEVWVIKSKLDFYAEKKDATNVISLINELQNIKGRLEVINPDGSDYRDISALIELYIWLLNRNFNVSNTLSTNDIDNLKNYANLSERYRGVFESILDQHNVIEMNEFLLEPINTPVNGKSGLNLGNNQSTIIDSKKDQMLLKVYPNPSNGLFTLEYELRSPNATIEVYDLNGKLMYTSSLKGISGQHNFDLSTLSKGVYLLKVNADEASSTQRIIKQ